MKMKEKRGKEKGMKNLGKKVNLKENKAITLIALVVTIVVLLILAGISLNLVLGDNGIITRAQEAKTKTEQDAANTETAIAELTEEMEEYIADKTSTGEAITTETSYIGYYADMDADGTVDGIIFADLAVAGSGKWNNDDWSNYSWEAVSGLKTYTISEETQTPANSKFGAKQVITPASTDGNDRFYVMALNDVTTNDYSTFYWYYNAYSKASLDRIVATDYNDFGEGKNNTIKMKNDWENNTSTYGDQNTRDLWGLWSATGDNAYKITSTAGSKTYDMVTSINDSKKWFVPSKAEWSAFGDYLYTKEGVTTSNYGNFGLSDGYWSSSQGDAIRAYYANFDIGGMSYYFVSGDFYVRLCATF